MLNIKKGVKLTTGNGFYYVEVEGPHGWIVQGEWKTLDKAYKDFQTTESYSLGIK